MCMFFDCLREILIGACVELIVCIAAWWESAQPCTSLILVSRFAIVAPSRDTDIFEAVKQDNVDMLLEVIRKQKVSVAVTDKDGATPLMYAARKGNVKVKFINFEINHTNLFFQGMWGVVG